MRDMVAEIDAYDAKRSRRSAVPEYEQSIKLLEKFEVGVDDRYEPFTRQVVHAKTIGFERHKLLGEVKAKLRAGYDFDVRPGGRGDDLLQEEASMRHGHLLRAWKARTVPTFRKVKTIAEQLMSCIRRSEHKRTDMVKVARWCLTHFEERLALRIAESDASGAASSVDSSGSSC